RRSRRLASRRYGESKRPRRRRLNIRAPRSERHATVIEAGLGSSVRTTAERGDALRTGLRELPFLGVLLLGGGGAAPSPNPQVSEVSAVGTLVYVALKVPVCAATLVVAAPL